MTAATNKYWWGYYDMPRLSLETIKRSSPEIGKHYAENPDRLLSLQVDALSLVYNLMDKTYHIESVPLEHQKLLLNANLHMSLLKKQGLSPETLTDNEKAQLKFMREKELLNFYQTYLALCRRTIRISGTNTVNVSRLATDIKNGRIDASLKTEILNTNTVTDVIRIR